MVRFSISQLSSTRVSVGGATLALGIGRDLSVTPVKGKGGWGTCRLLNYSIPKLMLYRITMVWFSQPREIPVNGRLLEGSRFFNPCLWMSFFPSSLMPACPTWQFNCRAAEERAVREICNDCQSNPQGRIRWWLTDGNSCLAGLSLIGLQL